MLVVLAPDSFKESMTSNEAAEAMARGVLSVFPNALCLRRPVADGGEGTTHVLVEALGGTLETVSALDGFGKATHAKIGLIDSLAVIEVASVVGLDQVAVQDRNPMRATSAGVANLVIAAIERGANRIIVGLGGSSVNDGGCGLLEGLGARFFLDGEPVKRLTPQDFGSLSGIDISELDPRLQGVDLELAIDVDNPLLGPQGATYMYGPQKGLTGTQITHLDKSLEHYVNLLERSFERPIRDEPGAGAAGGLGAAFMLLGGRPKKGIDLIAGIVGLEEAISKADLVLTGEGTLDRQTLSGKAPAGVASLAKRHGVQVIAFGGRVDPDINQLNLSSKEFTAVVPILPGLMSLPEALKAGPRNLEIAVEMAMRLLNIGRGAAATT